MPAYDNEILSSTFGAQLFNLGFNLQPNTFNLHFQPGTSEFASFARIPQSPGNLAPRALSSRLTSRDL